MCLRPTWGLMTDKERIERVARVLHDVDRRVDGLDEVVKRVAMELRGDLDDLVRAVNAMRSTKTALRRKKK